MAFWILWLAGVLAQEPPAAEGSAAVRPYFQLLVEKAAGTKDLAGDALLDACLRAVVARALAEGTPGESCKLAWIALALFLDSRDRLIQQPPFATYYAGLETEAERRERKRISDRATLCGRPDLATHFFAAAALSELVGDRHALSLGIAKELEDARRLEEGLGAGFSFADLCANEAGVRFAGHVRRRPESLLPLAELALADYMPSIEGFPEELGDQDLLDDYGGVHGDRFQVKLATVRDRIGACPAYRRTSR